MKIRDTPLAVVGCAFALIALAIFLGPPWPSPCHSEPVRTVTAYYSCDEKDADWWLVRLGGVAALIAVFQFVMFWLQWRVMRAGLSDSLATAKAAARQADAAEDALFKLERPHLFVENVKFVGHAPPGSQWHPADENEAGRATFTVAYDIVNYGRSPAIIKERAGGVFIGRDFPSVPSPNPNDVWQNEIALGPGQKRGPFNGYFWRGKMTLELLNDLTMNPVGLDGFVQPKIYFFASVKYESVNGLADEVGVLWEFNVGAQQWVQEPWHLVQYPNYIYRRLGERNGAAAPR